MIEMLKVNLEKKIENTSKLIRTFNKMENRVQIIKKQSVNQSIKTKTYASVVKIITKTITNNNKTKNNVKKVTIAKMIVAKNKTDD